MILICHLLIVPIVSSPSVSLLCDKVCDNFLHQLVKDPTHHLNVLDLVFTNQPDLVEDVQVTDNLPHQIMMPFSSCLMLLHHPSFITRVLYNYKKAYLSLLRDILFHVPWSIIEGTWDIEESWQLSKDLFLSAISVSVPRVWWKKKKTKHWFSYETIHLIRQKRWLSVHIISLATPSPDLLQKYIILCNTVFRLTRLGTKQHTERICLRYHGNPKKFWNWVDSSKNKCQPIPILMQNGQPVKNDQDKANVFNCYFIQFLPRKTCQAFFKTVFGSSLSCYIVCAIYCPWLFAISRKACVPDLCYGSFSPLSYLFCKSMDTGTLPRNWVSANVVPVFEWDDRHIPSNYWPVSLTSVVVKTMELIIHSELTAVLESHQLISTQQFGLHKNHSITHLLLEARLKHCSVLTVSIAYSLILLRHLTVCLTNDFCLNCSPWVFRQITWLD